MVVMVHDVVVVVHDVVDRVVHDVVVVMDRRSGHGRDGGKTDNHRRGDQQFLKHSLSP
jgi:hypothetical protein